MVHGCSIRRSIYSVSLINSSHIMRIYVADLAKYNNGELAGEWVELDVKTQLWDEIKRICGDHEWVIHDYELPFKIDEHENIDNLQQLASIWDGLSNYEKAGLSFLVDNGNDLSFALEHYENLSIYTADSWEDFAEELVDQGCFGDIPERLQYYIDYEAIGHDLSIDHTEYEFEGQNYYIADY